MWTEKQLSYLAGILDGEGSIGIEHLSPYKSRKKDYYVCRLTVVNTSLKLMNWLKDTFGGQFDMRKLVTGRKPCYRWHIFGDSLENIIIAVEPYLMLKRQQAQIILQYRQTINHSNRLISDEILAARKHLWLACKDLNKVGL